MKEDAILTEKQRLIGARTVCQELANTWKESIISLNGNMEKCLIEIDKRRNEKTLHKTATLWEMIKENQKNTGMPYIIAKLVLNTPGVWENSLPNLKKIAVQENADAIFYEEIKCKNDLEKTISYLKIGATNKISLLLTN